MESQISHSEIQLVIIDSPPPPNSNANSNSIPTHHHHHLLSIISSTLTKFHAGYFRISLSLGGQTLLWKTLVTQSSHSHVLHLINPTTVAILWFFAFFILVVLSFLYILRCFSHFELVKAEFMHHVGRNYLFAPWISWLLLLQSTPFVAPESTPYLVMWWIFVVPIAVLDVKIYGQWFTKGKWFLTAVANPTSQLSVIGNLVGAQSAARMGWQELSVCLFSLGMVHYLVLFVTLYQRLSGGDRIPAILRPVFFLFLAAPSMGSLAWDSIVGKFDTASKMLFFLSLFLFTSLVCRPKLFRKSMKKFNLAWWAYSYPVTLIAIASTGYAHEVKGRTASALMFIFSTLSILVTIGLLLFTAVNTKMLLRDDESVFTLPNHSPTSRSRTT